MYSTLPVVTQYGVTMYASTNGLEVNGIYDGLPIDNTTIYWDIDSDGNRVLKAIGSSGGGVADSVAWSNIEGKPSWLLDNKISYSEIEGTPDLSKYALVSQIPSLEGYALSSDLAKYIPISGYTDITGEKNFTGGLKVNGNPIYYDTEKKYWKLEGDLLVTGGVTMYGNDSDFVASTIMDAILYDDTTLGINSQGQLYVKGSVGGATTLGSLSNVGSWADSVASQDRIMYQAANSSQWVAKNLSDLAVGGVTGDYLPLTGGELSGSLAVTAIRNGYWAGGIRIDGTTSKYPSVGFHIANVVGSRLYVNESFELIFEWSTYNPVARHKVLHSGNYYNYALPLSGGTIKSTAVPQLILQGESTDAYITFKTTLNTADSAHSGLVNLPSVGVSASFGVSERIVFPFSGGMYYRNGYNGTNQTIWHAGNDGPGSGLDADLLDGFHVNGSQKPYGKIPLIGVDGVMEVGKYFDFHNDNTTGSDFSTRLQCSGEHGNTISLPSANGTLALTSSNVASATKLQTARTIWGQSFDGTGNVSGTLSGVNDIGFASKGNYVVGTFDKNANTVYTNNIHSGKGNNLWLKSTADTYITNSDGTIKFLTILSTGNVGIGTTNPTQKLHVAGPILADAFYAIGGIYGWNADTSVTFNNRWGIYQWGHLLQITQRDVHNNFISSPISIDLSNGMVAIAKQQPTCALDVSGNILASGGITMYSARKLKTIQDERGLSLKELSVIKPTRFTWKDGRDDKVHIGGIADDVQKVLPEVIYKAGEDNTLTMDYGNAAFAIAASLIKPVVNHEERIKILEEENKRLKEEVEQLKWNIA